jgi:hypothetical protein
MVVVESEVRIVQGQYMFDRKRLDSNPRFKINIARGMSCGPPVGALNMSIRL